MIRMWLAMLLVVCLAGQASGQCGYEFVGTVTGGGAVQAPFAIDADNAAFWTNGGLQYVDTSVAGEPRFTTFVDLGWTIRSFSRQGSIHYIGTANGLRVVDMSVPGVPEVIAHVKEASGGYTAIGDLLLSPSGGPGPTLYDISDPSDPRRLSTHRPNHGSTGAVARSGDLAWTRVRPGSGSPYLQAWDISTRKLAVPLSRFDSRHDITWMHAFGDVLYLIENGCLKVVDYQFPMKPKLLIESCEIAPLVPWLIGDTLYLRTNVIIPVDVSNPREPLFDEPVTVLNNENLGFRDLNMSNGVLTAGLGSGGFATVRQVEQRILDVTGLAFQYASGNAPAMRVHERLITDISESSRLLTVLSTENPERPEVVWQRLYHGTVGQPAFDGDIAFLPGNLPRDSIPAEVLVYDFSDLSDPVLLTTIPILNADFVTWLAEPGRFYIIGNLRQLKIYDTTDPANPMLIGESDIPPFDLSASPGWLRRAGDVLYLEGRRSREYLAIDISDETNPVWTDFDRWNTLGPPIVRGNRLYASPLGVGSMFDITDPFEFEVVGELLSDEDYSLGQLLDVRGFRRFLTVVDYPGGPVEEGILIQSIFDPDEPEALLFIPGEEFAGDYAVRGDYAYVMRRGGGITTYHIDGCEVCVADYSGDGRINFFDLAEFLNDYNSRAWKGDLTQDSVWDMDDVLFMIDAFVAGCP